MAVREQTSSEIDPAARGCELGESLRAEVQHTVAFYRRLFWESAGFGEDAVRHFGGEVRRDLIARHPRLLAEIDGIAVGAGVDSDTLVAVNARTELLVGGSFSAGRTATGGGRRSGTECSNVALLPDATVDGTMLLGQTWDFHPDLFASRVLWTFPVDGERWVTTFTEAGILAKVGFNGDGVGLTMAFLASRHDRSRGGTPIHLLARLVLETSRNASDALRLLHAERTCASVALTVAYAEEHGVGFAASAELSPRGVHLVYPDDHGVLAHTNHFLHDPGAADLATGPDGWHGTLVRRDFLIRALRRSAARDELDGATLERLFKTRFNAPESVCVRAARGEGDWFQEVETLAMVLFDLTHLSVVVDDGVRGGERIVHEHTRLPVR